MGIAFLEFMLLILALYLITQIFLPAMWPSIFSYNWAFKKKKPIDDKITSIKNKKARLEGEVDEMKDEITGSLEKSKQAAKEVKKL